MFPDFKGVPSFFELGAWTINHIKPVFDLFRQEDVAPALALIIFCIALGLCVLFLIDTIYIRIQLRRRTRAVRRIKDNIEFAAAMPRVERLMLSSRYLRHSWQKFRETLIEPIPTDDRALSAIHNTARPQEYFNTSEAGLRFPIYRAIPNLLVGIGLLLTFLGLVSALFFTTTAIKDAAANITTNQDALTASQNALRDLLYAASFKFYTSIAGLGGSIILTLVIRYGIAAIESNFDALSSALEAKLSFVTPASIAFKHYLESKEQTRNLRLFNTEVAISVGKRIEEALASSLPTYLAQAMEPIGKRLDEVANKLTSMNEGAIGEMAGSFADRLQGATAEQMQGLASTLNGLKNSLEQMNRSVSESGSSLSENVARSNQEMCDAVIAMTSALNDMTSKAERGVDDSRLAMNQQLEAAAKTFEAVSQNISSMLNETLGRMSIGSQEASSRLAAELTTATGNFRMVSEQLAGGIQEAVVALTRGLVSETSAIGGRITDATLHAGEESRAKIVEAGASVAQTVSKMGQQLNDIVDRLQDGLVGTVREMQSIERGIGQHVIAIGQLSRATQETEGAMSNSARSMREAGQPLAESSRLIADASSRISDAAKHSEQSIVGAQVEIQNISQLLHATLERTAQQWEAYERRFKDVDESLEVVLNRIIGSVQENLEALRGFVERMDEKLSSAIDRLGGGIEDLGEFAQTMEHITSRLNGGSGDAPRVVP
jgi:methyl-accepting chemotaxis protein